MLCVVVCVCHRVSWCVRSIEDGEETGEERQAAYTFLFVTCGNWDIKTQIPRQCAISKFDMPGYFHEWVNLKDVYLNFYKHKALGMRSMLSGLGIQLEGDHHSGKDDVHNICKVPTVVQQILLALCWLNAVCACRVVCCVCRADCDEDGERWRAGRTDGQEGHRNGLCNLQVPAPRVSLHTREYPPPARHATCPPRPTTQLAHRRR